MTDTERSVRIRTVVVDDHELVRDGLKALLSKEPGIEVVGEAGTVAEAIRRVAFDEPDVVTLDVDLPDGSGVDACRPIKMISPDTRILILTAFADARVLSDAKEQGADGFVLKRTGDFQLIEKIRLVIAGEKAFDETPPADSMEGELQVLTPRELSILELIADGKTNREIADALYLAEKTVKNYVSNLLAKLGVKHRSAAAAYLVRVRGAQQHPFPPSEWPASVS